MSASTRALAPPFSPPLPERGTAGGTASAAASGATRASDLAACRALLRSGSRTFLAASLLLPRSVREPACALYAFCREADDVVDAQGTESNGLERLRERLRMVYAATPLPAPTDRALAEVIARFDIPRTFFDALLEGFEWDALGRRYETLDELHDYASRVAGSVGAMMALVMGVRSPQGLARACELGVAMQLSNVARDVGEDARMGRLYLPRQWLLESGIDPDGWLARPVFTPALAGVVRRLLDAADRLYQGADAGVSCLPLACRPGINAARYLYAEIGRQVDRNGFDSVSSRAFVSRSRKACLLLRALSSSIAVTGAHGAPLPATAFLVEAAAGRRYDSKSTRRRPVNRGIGERVAWTIDLFVRLEQRDRALAARAQPRRA